MNTTMNKIISFILVMILALAALTLTGCAGNTEMTVERNAVCFVIGNTANSQGLNLNSPLVQDTLYYAVRYYGFVAVVNADGDPQVIYASDFNIDDRLKSASKDKLDMEARANTTNILLSMQSVIADDPEVDYLESLKLAARTLKSVDGYDSKSIVMVGTGLSTTGVMNFRNNLLCGEPDTVVGLLRDRSEIPDFKGITVYTQQLGDVAAPQQALNGSQRDKLEAIYRGIVEAGGGTFHEPDTFIANPVDTSKSYPFVSTVQLPVDDPIAFDEAMFDKQMIVIDEPIFLTEERVSFVGDEDVYLRPGEAIDTLRPIAEYLNDHSSINIVLAGTTAGDTDTSTSLSLSKQRAERVKATLIELGVAGERIVTIGLGSENDPWHISNAGYEGAAASSNRKVVVLDASSERAVALLGSFNH